MFQKFIERKTTIKQAKIKAKELLAETNKLTKNIQDKALAKQVKKCAKVQAKQIVNNAIIELKLDKAKANDVSKNINNINVEEETKDVLEIAKRKSDVCSKLSFRQRLKVESGVVLHLTKRFLKGDFYKTIKLLNNQSEILGIIESISERVSRAHERINVFDILAWIDWDNRTVTA